MTISKAIIQEFNVILQEYRNTANLFLKYQTIILKLNLCFAPHFLLSGDL